RRARRYLVYCDSAFAAGSCHDLAEGLLERSAEDVDAEATVIFELQGVERLQRTHQGDAATGDDAFLDGRAGRMERVLDAGLLLLHLDLGGRADLDDGHAADELGEALLQLLAVVVRRGLLDL